PELATMIRDSPVSSLDIASLELDSLPMLRESHLALFAPVESPAIVHRDLTVPATGSRAAVRVRVYLPVSPGSERACVIWMHGGGFLFGTPLGEEVRANHVVEEFDCVVVSVDFRLAPEHRYPAAIEDCYSALLWAAEHAEELGM